MATKLSIYNGALAILGETPLASLSEDRSARYWLDRAWDNGIVDDCLEQGQWAFATRSQKITNSTSITPAFGYRYAFEIPDDFKGLIGIWTDDYFSDQLEKYFYEADVIYCDYDTIYIKFVSNAATYGYNLARWTQVFSKYVEHHLAVESEPNISNNPSLKAKLETQETSKLIAAKNFDKRNKQRKKMEAGTWVSSRSGNTLYRPTIYLPAS